MVDRLLRRHGPEQQEDVERHAAGAAGGDEAVMVAVGIGIEGHRLGPPAEPHADVGGGPLEVGNIAAGQQDVGAAGGGLEREGAPHRGRAAEDQPAAPCGPVGGVAHGAPSRKPSRRAMSELILPRGSTSARTWRNASARGYIRAKPWRDRTESLAR